MLIKLGKVNSVICNRNYDDKIENKKIEIEVTTDEYIFNKVGLFSSKEIIRIKKKDVTSITNENLHDIMTKRVKDEGLDTGKMQGTKYMYVNCNYLTFKKKSVDSVKLYFDNKTSSDVDNIITQLK